MTLPTRAADALYKFLSSKAAFAVVLGLLILSAGWIAITSLYPMAFDEEFHYGLITIYATSLLPFGIEHTSDMAQYGAATADASYLFHYLMSFPYRLLDFIGLSNNAIIVILRFINIAFVAAGLAVFRRAFIEAGVGHATATIALALVTVIPVFSVLAAHINYDNLLFLVIAWCALLIVRLSKAIYSGKVMPLRESVLLAVAVLIGMSIKYAFLPLALAILLWVVWLVIVAYRRHKQTIASQLVAYKSTWRSSSKFARRTLIGLVGISLFFASHYVTNTLTYGSLIPSCEQVFSETECTAYGPWYRNELLKANKSPSFMPLSFPEYMAQEWLPGMTQRLTFAVAGKTNDFQTQLPFPALVLSLTTLSLIGLFALLIQLFRKKITWLMGFACLITFIYVAVLSIKLYGGYIRTAEPVAINGRYLIPLLPLVAVTLITAIRQLLSGVDSRTFAATALIVCIGLLICGGGALTYVVLAQSHWFWNGFGQTSHAALQALFERIVLPYR